MLHTLVAAALPSPSAPRFMVMLSAGTPVQVTLNEALDLDVVMVGHAVDFTVRNNVTVNGKVLIAAGAWASGVVRKVKMGCDGNCGTITITGPATGLIITDTHGRQLQPASLARWAILRNKSD